MLTIHSLSVAVRGGVVNSEAIAGPPRAGLAHPATSPRRLPPTSPSCRSCCSGRRLFEHFRFSSNSGHIAAPREPTS